MVILVNHSCILEIYQKLSAEIEELKKKLNQINNKSQWLNKKPSKTKFLLTGVGLHTGKEVNNDF
jgi:predicted methyltransferase MtxX (methanogen marker protein 4)